MKVNNKSITIRIPATVVSELEKIAKDKGLSLSWVIRKLIEKSDKKGILK